MPPVAGPGWGGSHFRHRYGSVTGTVATLPGTTLPTTFTITVSTPTRRALPLRTTLSTLTPALTGTATTETVTVDVSATTTVHEPGVASPSWSDLALGDRVVVVGTQAGTGTVGAVSVVVPLALESGTVASLPGATLPTTFTITTGRAPTVTTVTVDVRPPRMCLSWGRPRSPCQTWPSGTGSWLWAPKPGRAPWTLRPCWSARRAPASAAQAITSCADRGPLHQQVTSEARWPGLGAPRLFRLLAV